MALINAGLSLNDPVTASVLSYAGLLITWGLSLMWPSNSSEPELVQPSNCLETEIAWGLNSGRTVIITV